MADTTLFRTVLCPVDFSEHSRQALAYASVLAARKGGRLVVVFAEDPLLAAAAAVAYNEKMLIEKGRRELRRFVEKTIAPTGLSWSSITLDVAIGKPHQVIEWTADQLGCDLIVMGAHGLTGANKMMLGSTTHRILRRSQLPVLATPPVTGRWARPPRGWPGKMAIAPIDFSARDRADALAAAVAAKELGTQLELVHVVEPIADVPWLELDEARRNLQRERRAAARLTRLQDDLHWAVTGVRVETGKPADKIAAIAAQAKVGLVVMTRRKGQGLFGPRQGSISYQVLCKSKTPVLALPSDSKWMRRVVRRSR
jgi:nucleotide-binding universal stress UspA family protein